MPAYCSAFGCTNLSKKGSGVRFFCFPSAKHQLQRRLKWIRAVKRIGKNGKEWQPTKWSYVCSAHFQTGKPSKYSTHPDFAPSVFKYRHARSKGSIQDQRFQRLKFRNRVKAQATIVNPVPQGYRDGIYTHPPLKKDAVPSQNLPQLKKIQVGNNSLPESRCARTKRRDAAKLGPGSKTGSTAVSATNPRTEIGGGDASESSSGDSRPQTSPRECEKTNDVLCKCGQSAPLATVRTQGPNWGRKFYKCGNLNKCIFFRWADNQPPVLKRVVMNGVDQIISTLCRCNYPAKLLGNDISSNLRGFFGCGNPKGRSCSFFQWAKAGNCSSTQTASVSGARTGRAAAPTTNLKDVTSSVNHDDDNTEESSSWSPNEMISSNVDETNDILCMCGHVALLRTVKTTGQNCGRKFYMCGNMRKCIFFRWGDQQFSASPAVTNSMVEKVTVTCQCNQPAKLQTVYKAGPTTGRQFFGCANPRGLCCTFFQWADKSNNAITAPNCSVRSGGKSTKAAANVKNRKEVGSCDDSDYERESPPQSLNLIPKSDPEEMNNVLCTCGFAARLLTVKTEGLNYGRQFYKCGNTNSCHFFLWADDELLALRLAVHMNGVDENFTVACRCDNAAKLLTVEKDGPNSGRQFFGCEQSCGFFRWVDTDNHVPATSNSFLVIKEECLSDNSEEVSNNSHHFSEDREFEPVKLEPLSEDNNSDHFSEDPEFDPPKLEPPSDYFSIHSLPEKRKRKRVSYLEYVYPSDNSEDDSNNSGPVSEEANFDPPEVSNQSVPEKPKKKCGLCSSLDHTRNTCPRNRSRRK